MEWNKTMKNKYFSFVALAAAALATSCASDDLAEQKQEQNQNGTRTVTLTASVNEGQTRVGMTKNTDGKTASFYWHEDDQIFVQTKNGDSYSGAAFGIKKTTSNATSATFTGTVASGSEVGTYAVYPYDSEKQQHSFTGEKTLTYVLPASYDSYTVGKTIFSNTTPTNMPMLGTIKDKSISFKCLGGLAVIRIASMPAESGTLTVSANEKLSGSFTVSDLSADEAKLATTSTDVTDDDKKVAFNFTGAEKGGVGVFYLPLATGSYSGVKITIDSQTETINYGSLSVARKSVTAIPLYATGSNGALTKFSKIDGNVYTLNGHEFVDLGLDVLWATMNVGATAATEAGGYFAWGETTSGKSTYSDSNYKFWQSSAYTKYNSTDNLTTLEAEDDAATANWGAGVRMPTKAEFEALNSGCSVSYDRQNSIYTVTGNSQTISLPSSTGYYMDSQQCTSQDLYWTSSLPKSDYVVNVTTAKMDDEEITIDDNTCRYFGCPVRAVTEK